MSLGLVEKRISKEYPFGDKLTFWAFSVATALALKLDPLESGI